MSSEVTLAFLMTSQLCCLGVTASLVIGAARARGAEQESDMSGRVGLQNTVALPEMSTSRGPMRAPGRSSWAGRS